MKSTSRLSLGMIVTLFALTGSHAFAQNQSAQLPSAGLTPESPFYFLDRLGERLTEFFTFNPEAKAKLQIEFAGERIAEIKIMLEEKGVDAKGLAKAESSLLANVTRAAEIVDAEKTAGKDVSTLAKTLNDEFDAKDKLLTQTFQDTKEQLKSQREDAKTKLQEARRAGDTAEVATLNAQLDDTNQQMKALDRKKNQLKNSLQDEQKGIESEMDEADQQKEEIKNKEEQDAIEAKDALEIKDQEEADKPTETREQEGDR